MRHEWPNTHTGVFGDSWLTLRRLLQSLGTVKVTFLRRIDDIYYMLHTLVETHLTLTRVHAILFGTGRSLATLYNVLARTLSVTRRQKCSSSIDDRATNNRTVASLRLCMRLGRNDCCVGTTVSPNTTTTHQENFYAVRPEATRIR